MMCLEERGNSIPRRKGGENSLHFFSSKKVPIWIFLGGMGDNRKGLIERKGGVLGVSKG